MATPSPSQPGLRDSNPRANCSSTVELDPGAARASPLLSCLFSCVRTQETPERRRYGGFCVSGACRASGVNGCRTPPQLVSVYMVHKSSRLFASVSRLASTAGCFRVDAAQVRHEQPHFVQWPVLAHLALVHPLVDGRFRSAKKPGRLFCDYPVGLTVTLSHRSPPCCLQWKRRGVPLQSGAR